MRKQRSDRKPKITRHCKVCGKEFEISQYVANNRLSLACCFNHGQILRRKRIKITCPECGIVFESCPADKDRKYCSLQCRNVAYSRDRKGNKTHLWQGGITNENLLERTRSEAIEWRRQVFERDEYTCQCCGDNRGHNLQAHHILFFSKFKLLRYEVSNGITVCIPCHKLIHKNKGIHPKWEDL